MFRKQLIKLTNRSRRSIKTTGSSGFCGFIGIVYVKKRSSGAPAFLQECMSVVLSKLHGGDQYEVLVQNTGSMVFTREEIQDMVTDGASSSSEKDKKPSRKHSIGLLFPPTNHHQPQYQTTTTSN